MNIHRSPLQPKPSKKKEGGAAARVAVLAIAPAQRKARTREVLGRDLANDCLVVVYLTGRGCLACQLSFPVTLQCEREGQRLIFSQPTNALLNQQRFTTGRSTGTRCTQR